MSISASIDLRIVESSSGKIVSPIKTLGLLRSNGWNVFNKNGFVFYLPIGDNEMFDWIGNKIDEVPLMQILEEKEQKGELIGIGLTWQNTEIGGEVLLWSEKEMMLKNIHTSMSFCLTRDRKILDSHLKMTDVNWYLTKLLPTFDQKNVCVEYFTYEEHI